MRAVGTYDRRGISFLVVQRHLDLAGVGHYVIIRHNVALLIDDESRSLALLRHQTIEEVEGDGPRSDVHHRGDILVVDVDVVLLFGVQRFMARGFGDVDFAGAADPASRTGRDFDPNDRW